jgi:hypothetical protein
MSTNYDNPDAPYTISTGSSKSKSVGSMPKIIYCLFSVYNDYNQPANNLVAWFPIKPKLEVIAKTLDIDLSIASDEQVITVANLFQGKEVYYNSTNYRIQEVVEGSVLPESE